jgi:hypothetical protein
MVKKTIVAVFTFVMMSLGTDTLAQGYQTGVGLRLGVSNGLTVKHFISGRDALEGIFHTRWGGVVLTGLYEVHKDIPEAAGLRWFYGGGVHIGTWNGDRGRSSWGDHQGQTIFGIDGIIGLDYPFEVVPIGLSLDYKPAFNISNNAGFWGDEVALSIRYIF